MRNDWKIAWLKALLRALICLVSVLSVSCLALIALSWTRGEEKGLSALGAAAGTAWREGIRPLLLSVWRSGGALDVREAAAEGTVLLMMGLSFGVCLRAGRLNLGAPAQYVMGGLIALVCAAQAHLSWYMCLGAAMAAGAAAGLISAFARRLKRAADVTADLLMDAIAMYGALAALEAVRTEDVAASSMIPALAENDLLARPVTMAAAIAAVVVLGLWIVESRTTTGYRLRLLGASDEAAANAGVRVRSASAACMAISGALAGLAGGCGMLSGMTRIPAAEASLYGLGAALLSAGHPLGTVLSAGVITHLKSGCAGMESPFDGQRAAWLILGALIPACACFLRAAVKKREMRRQSGKEGAL